MRAEASRLRAPSSEPPPTDEEDDDSGDPDARDNTGVSLVDGAPVGAANATFGSAASDEEDSDDEDDDED